VSGYAVQVRQGGLWVTYARTDDKSEARELRDYFRGRGHAVRVVRA
jgi:hypothetical protein